MLRYLFLSLCIIIIADANHFNGGTIRWAPTNPYNNASLTTITVIQSYWWSYPLITCANSVPISTSGRSAQNSNLTCVTDCSTDGGYSFNSVNILTNCTFASSTLGIMTSERSANITLTSNAHFYLAHVGSAWRALNYPTTSGLQWSIVTSIDLRIRPDGFINTPPVASVVSPQYVIVNQPTQIQIPVSDANAGDDVRCRWSVYTPGYRRRKRSHEEEKRPSKDYAAQLYKTVIENEEIIHVRRKRACGSCNTICAYNCDCGCNGCASTTCSGSTCKLTAGCTAVTTTVETPGTLKATSSYPNRQPIDECGGICYPDSVPYGATLSNCTLSLTGLMSGVWYAVAIQVEDFINTQDMTPMSSVPVQFLIYVLPQPTCSNAPIILPLAECLEATIGVAKSFNLFMLNLCDPTISNITGIMVSQGVTGMQMGNLTVSTTNTSLVYQTFSWTPQASQLGSQQLCVIAYTSEQIQSILYCVAFAVVTSVNVCATTTTSATTTFATNTSSTISAGTLSIPMMTTTASSVRSTSISSAVTSKTVAPVAEDDSGKKLYWGLIAGLSSLGALLLLLLCCFCCMYCCYWHPAAKRRLQEREEEEQWQQRYLSSSTESMRGMPSYIDATAGIQIPKETYPVYNGVVTSNNTRTSYMIIRNNPVAPTIPRWPPYDGPTIVQT